LHNRSVEEIIVVVVVVPDIEKSVCPQSKGLVNLEIETNIFHVYQILSFATYQLDSDRCDIKAL